MLTKSLKKFVVKDLKLITISEDEEFRKLMHITVVEYIVHKHPSIHVLTSIV